MKKTDMLYHLCHFEKLLFMAPGGMFAPGPVTYCVKLSRDNQFVHSWWADNGLSWGPQIQEVEPTMEIIGRLMKHYIPPSPTSNHRENAIR